MSNCRTVMAGYLLHLFLYMTTIYTKLQMYYGGSKLRAIDQASDVFIIVGAPALIKIL